MVIVEEVDVLIILVVPLGRCAKTGVVEAGRGVVVIAIAPLG
jgi:hypothetical protein